jgi:PHD/YefM family antitoxin component YafN of YafNO toxin-antitoxin module
MEGDNDPSSFRHPPIEVQWISQAKENAMSVPLPEELRTVVIAHPGAPVELVDERTQAAYVLLPAEEFERLKTAAEDDLSDTYAAQMESAMRAGWDDPRMDEYNDYDAHRGPA